VLSINTVNYISINVISLLVTIDILENSISCLFEIFNTVCLFWLDLLNLTNGLCFLLIFKKISERPKFKREFYTTQETAGSDPLNQFKRKDYGTASLKRLLETSQFSKDSKNRPSIMD
jgi:hypothetical protein